MRDIAGSRAKLAFVWLLLAAALLVRAAVPQGDMTERADDGAVQARLLRRRAPALTKSLSMPRFSTPPPGS